MASIPSAAPGDDGPRTLVVVFLRGGADGLTLVPPVGDDAYHRLRPRIAVPARDGLALDGLFALNPLLAPLLPWYREGRLAVVHAAGSQDDTRSHFEAQDLMEQGGIEVGGGWLGRWLRRREQLPDGGRAAAGGGALAAVAIGDSLPQSLRGAPGATVLRSLAELVLADGDALRAPLGALYADDPLLGGPALNTLDALDRLGRLRDQQPAPAHGARYADDAFSAGLRQVAGLIKAGVGLEAATIDLAGWDSHFVQGTIIEPLMRSLADGLAAFATDLGPLLARTSVVVMSEFGRRVLENSALGTDHGRGGAMLVLGGGTRGGMHCRWPGLNESVLVGPGDLPVVHDYRDVLAAVLARHDGAAALPMVFPAYEPQPLPV